MDKRKLKGLSYLLTLCMIFSLMVFNPISAEGLATELLITGSGIHSEVKITSSDWSKYKMTERFYSTNNSLSFHKIVKAKGYDLFDLIGKSNLKSDKDYTVKFTCADGFVFI